MFVDDYEPRVEDIKRDLESTMGTMTDTIQSLLERGLARYLPVSM
jgi:DNA-binding MarR family transcriptional regulator